MKHAHDICAHVYGCIRTVDTIQLDSRMAPQHPKNAIKNIIDPMIMNNIGATPIFTSLNASNISSYFSRKPAPTATNAMPNNCKMKNERSKKQYLEKRIDKTNEIL